jgi:hypothetical protein
VPDETIAAIVDLVGTGPVDLGAYTVAELTVVDAIVDFLSARPSDEVLTEAVRSLVARKLLVAGDGPGQVEVRGDLGIAAAFQQRARVALDARVTGTEAGEPWRMLLLPQPEPIGLLVRIDALGIYEMSLRKLDDALKLVAGWLPRGRAADVEDGPDADSVLAGAERSALVTVTRYTTQGTAETAGGSRDLVLARRDGRLHAFAPDAGDGRTLLPVALNGKETDETLAGLLRPGHGNLRALGSPSAPRSTCPPRSGTRPRPRSGCTGAAGGPTAGPGGRAAGRPLRRTRPRGCPSRSRRSR